jgi:hypothetical protein
MHLENIIDLVVESLLPAEQERFQLRRLHAKERLMTSLVLHNENCCKPLLSSPALSGASKSGAVVAKPRISARVHREQLLLTNQNDYTSEEEGHVGRTNIKRKHGCENVKVEASARLKRIELLCEGCDERGHTLEECPHRDTGSSEAGSDDEAMSGGDY